LNLRECPDPIPSFFVPFVTFCKNQQKATKVDAAEFKLRLPGFPDPAGSEVWTSMADSCPHGIAFAERYLW
jgi:hypothetical protein